MIFHIKIKFTHILLMSYCYTIKTEFQCLRIATFHFHFKCLTLTKIFAFLKKMRDKWKLIVVSAY